MKRRYCSLFLTASIALAGCRPASAEPFAPYPKPEPGTVYHYAAFEADAGGKLKRSGNATLKISAPIRVGEHDYLRSDLVVNGKDFGEVRYRFDKEYAVLGSQAPDTESSLITMFANPPKPGTQIQTRTVTTRVIEQAPLTIEGVTYQNLIAVELMNGGQLTLRHVIDRDAGIVKTTLWHEGRIFGELLRLPKAP